MNTGGPAFPRPASEAHSHGMHSPQEGMTLRDYFAGQAMVSVLNTVALKNLEMTPEAVADLAYKRADAMLKAREQ